MNSKAMNKRANRASAEPSLKTLGGLIDFVCEVFDSNRIIRLCAKNGSYQYTNHLAYCDEWMIPHLTKYYTKRGFTVKSVTGNNNVGKRDTRITVYWQ
jgi:hypothetical protein